MTNIMNAANRLYRSLAQKREMATRRMALLLCSLLLPSVVLAQTTYPTSGRWGAFNFSGMDWNILIATGASPDEACKNATTAWAMYPSEIIDGWCVAYSGTGQAYAHSAIMPISSCGPNSTGPMSGSGICSCNSNYLADAFNLQCTPSGNKANLGGDNNNNCPGKKSSILVSNPIHAGVGNKYQEEIDYVGVSGLSFTRYYNSGETGSPANMGRGWTHTYSHSIKAIQRNGAGVAAVIRPDGKQLYFYEQAGVWLAPNTRDRLERLVDGSGVHTGWRYKSTHLDEIETYDAKGKLQSISRRDGQQITLTYSTGEVYPQAPYAGLLLSATDSFGRALTYYYYFSDQRSLGAVVIPSGYRFQYTFDAYNNQVSRIYPYYINNTPANGPTRQYHFENTTYPLALTGITDENGSRYATYGYDAIGRSNLSEHAGSVERHQFTFNGSGATSIVDGIGTPRNYTFQTIAETVLLAGVSQPGGSGCGPASSAITYDVNGNVATRTDFNGNQTAYTHDLTRDLETQRTEANGTPQARTINTQWHSYWSLPVKVAEPLKLTTWVYNGDTFEGNVVACAPASAVVPSISGGSRPIGVLCRKIEQATSDATGAQGFGATPTGTLRIWNYTYGDYGQLLAADGPRTDVSDVTTYTYHPANDPDLGKRGNPASVSNALGQTTQITTYDANGRPLTIVDPNGQTTSLTYHLRGWLTSRTVGGETTTYQYDNAGQLTRVTLPDGAYLHHTYDPAHRLTAITDRLGNSITYTLDGMGNRTSEQVRDPANQLSRTRSRVFDALSRLAQDIGAYHQPGVFNQITSYGYDPNGNLNSVTDPLNHTTVSVFDALNRLIQMTDPANGVTRYAYNGQDRITQVTDPRNLATTYTVDGLGNQASQASPDTGTTQNTYDAAGNVVTRTDAKGQISTYQYDALNRLTRITFADGSEARYTYDEPPSGIGRLTRIEDLSGGQAIAQVQYGYDLQGRVVSEARSVNGITATTTYGYANGRLSSMIYPSGRRIDYTRDVQGQITEVRLTDNGQVTVLAGNIEYLPFGGLKGYTNGAGQAYARSYDLDGRIASYSLAGQTWQVGYDNASRILFQADAGNAQNTASYGYDPTDRLTSAILPNTSLGYGYDPVGNRTTQAVGAATRNYTYAGNSNRLQSIDTAPQRSFTYDANGSITGDGQNTYGYDVKGRLVQATTTAGAVQYSLNALGQRIRKSGAGADVIYHYDQDGRLIAEANSQGITREYIYLGDIPLAVIQ